MDGIYRSQKNWRCEFDLYCLNISYSLKECVCINMNSFSTVLFLERKHSRLDFNAGQRYFQILLLVGALLISVRLILMNPPGCLTHQDGGESATEVLQMVI